MQNQKGFTFAEILVVISIISVIAIVATPSMMEWKEKNILKRETSRLVSWLHRAKIEAIKTNSFVVVAIQGNSYTVFVDNHMDDWVRQPGEREIATITVAEGIHLSSKFKNDRMRFSGTSGIRPGRFILRDQKGNQIQVFLNMIGTIRVSRSV